MEELVAKVTADNSSAQKTMASAMDRLTTSFEALGTTKKDAEIDAGRMTDKCNAITGLKLELKVPAFPDKDTNFAKHQRLFNHHVDLLSVGRVGIRPLDVLVLYKQALTPGGVRWRTYETIVNRAMKTMNLTDPNNARKVYEEIKERMEGDIRETSFQSQSRLDK